MTAYLVLSQINSILERELKFEMENYKIEKKIVNKLCDLGFLIDEKEARRPKKKEPENDSINSDEEDREKEKKTNIYEGNLFHRLVKTTPKFLVLINFMIKYRPMKTPEFLNED